MSLVVGIDIGNENCVVSAINKNGVADVVLNEASKRETPLLIHFDKKQRFFGFAGASYASRNPKATFTQIKRLISRRFDEPSFQKERHLLPYDTFEGPNCEIIARVDFAGKTWEFTAVELLGMFLCHLSKSVQKLTGSQISECVLGVPSYLTIQQRKDYLLAAEIAGLKPRRLFHDGAATALEYALSRDLPYGEAIHVVFVDIGHCDTQVTVVKFCFGTLTVLAHSFDRDLGGRNFDDKIFEHLVDNIQRKHHINVSADMKASFKLRAKCADAKKVLSVNSEASVNIECLMNDIDVEETITKVDFENMSSELSQKLAGACTKALMDAGLPKEQICSVELVGSGSRIPLISQILEDFFQQKISRTLNGSECIANGCALQCSMLCPQPPAVRTFGVHDMLPFSFGFRISNNSSHESSKIFGKNHLFLATKNLILSPTCKHLIIEYIDSLELPSDMSKEITHYKIISLDENQKCHVEIRFQFNIHGILDVLSASLVDKGLVENVPCEQTTNMEVDQAEATKTAENGCSFEVARNMEVDQNIRSETAENEISLPASLRIDNSIEVFVQGHRSAGVQDRKDFEISSATSCKIVSMAQTKETFLEKCDRANECAKNARNNLEAYLFQLRNAVSEKTVKFASRESSTSMLTKLRETDDWLYGMGADESEESYSVRKRVLRTAYDSLLAEHLAALDRATEKKNELSANAYYISDQLCEGKFLYMIKEEEHKLKSIFKMLKEVDLRSQEVYIKEIEELKVISNAIRSRKADSERQRDTGFVNTLKARLGLRSTPTLSNNKPPLDREVYQYHRIPVPPGYQGMDQPAADGQGRPGGRSPQPDREMNQPAADSQEHPQQRVPPQDREMNQPTADSQEHPQERVPPPQGREMNQPTADREEHPQERVPPQGREMNQPTADREEHPTRRVSSPGQETNQHPVSNRRDRQAHGKGTVDARSLDRSQSQIDRYNDKQHTRTYAIVAGESTAPNEEGRLPHGISTPLKSTNMIEFRLIGAQGRWTFTCNEDQTIEYVKNALSGHFGWRPNEIFVGNFSFYDNSTLKDCGIGSGFTVHYR